MSARISRSIVRFVSSAIPEAKGKMARPGAVLLEQNREHSPIFGSKSINKCPKGSEVAVTTIS